VNQHAPKTVQKSNFENLSKNRTATLADLLQLSKAMKELWTAQVHLLTPPSAGGNTRCCTNVVAWAENQADYQLSLTDIFARRSWSILNIYKCRRASMCLPLDDELAEQFDKANEQPGSCIFGTLHYYPSKPN